MGSDPASPAQPKSRDRRPDRRDDILQAVAFAAERFLRGDAFDAALGEVLARLGAASASSRVVLIERLDRPDGPHMHPRAEWEAADVPTLLRADLDGLPYFPRWAAELQAGRLVAGSAATFPDTERIPLEADGVGAIVVTPIIAGDRWWGHVGYDDRRPDRIWSDAEIGALRAAAGIIGASIRGAEVAAALERRNGILEAVAAAAPLLAASDRVEEGLSQLLESMRSAVDARSAWSYRLDRDGIGHLVMERVAPGERPATEFANNVALTAAGVERLIREGHVQTDDVFVDPGGVGDALGRLNIGSWVAVPILVEGQLRGAIGLDSVSDRSWTDGEVIALQVAAAAIAAAVLREATEDRLRQAAKMEAVGRVAGSLAHDFGNLLTIVRGRSELVLLESLDDGVRADVEAVHEASNRGADLVRDLLTFSRHRSGTIRPVDLGDRVVRVERMLARTVGSAITIEVDRATDVPAVLADPAELEHVLVNLVVNARDAMPNGGAIRIATGLAVVGLETMVTLTVADTGSGIDEATRARIFEPFFTTKPEGLGTGLGLATAYAAVTAWGGSIEVDSTPGVGTTFTLRLRPAAT